MRDRGRCFSTQGLAFLALGKVQPRFSTVKSSHAKATTISAPTTYSGKRTRPARARTGPRGPRRSAGCKAPTASSPSSSLCATSPPVHLFTSAETAAGQPRAASGSGPPCSLRLAAPYPLPPAAAYSPARRTDGDLLPVAVGVLFHALSPIYQAISATKGAASSGDAPQAPRLPPSLVWGDLSRWARKRFFGVRSSCRSAFFASFVGARRELRAERRRGAARWAQRCAPWHTRNGVCPVKMTRLQGQGTNRQSWYQEGEKGWDTRAEQAGAS